MDVFAGGAIEGGAAVALCGDGARTAAVVTASGACTMIQPVRSSVLIWLKSSMMTTSLSWPCVDMPIMANACGCCPSRANSSRAFGVVTVRRMGTAPGIDLKPLRIDQYDSLSLSSIFSSLAWQSCPFQIVTRQSSPHVLVATSRQRAASSTELSVLSWASPRSICVFFGST